ncbi:hypothetical protein EC912_10512 [Luteibacter rhizovicinus]|uniref:Uncharacterized protein n=1 Tax=Luteibacter rhizovicinus TaxID=242606 RepID=A0A4R3YQF2_9GAMM|nr:hypothetical protein [Luteibacter rhizovicinus]TCV93153.1 hypothetical protein EC912_10512 [Luteibacter rhizovicinus]
MRILIAGLIGGVVMFIWGAFAHMALPIGELSMRAPASEGQVIDALRAGLPQQEGIYVLPWFDMKRHDDASVKAYAERSAANPYAFIVYQPQGRDSTNMVRELPTQWISDTLAAILVAAGMLWCTPVRRRRVLLAVAFGVFSWLSISVPYWNWYRFPLAFTFGSLLEQGFGWLLAGAAMAWWLGRGDRLPS